METEFGESLFQLRHRCKKLQKTVAYMAGLDPSYVASLEKGRRDPPRREILNKLCAALAATPAECEQLHRAALASRLKKVWAEASGDTELANLFAKLAMALPALNAAERAAIETLVSACMRQHPPIPEDHAM